MRALHTREAAGIGIRRFGLGSYIVVGLLAAAIGVGAVTGFQAVVGEAEVTVAQQATVLRGEEAGANLHGLWQSGLAQQSAISEAAALQGRFEAGLAQAAAIEQYELLQSRIKAGEMQQDAILARQQTFQEAWEMRGAEMTRIYGHLGPGSYEAAWTMRGEAVPAQLYGLIASGLAQQEAMENR